MTKRRVELGADSELTLLQAQTTVETARRDAAAYAAQVHQDRNALDLLVGRSLDPANLPQAGAAAAATQLVAVPAELPSAVLQRRPDVLAAEHQLKAANADIGAARAALFPSISLTASAGTASRSLGDLFKGAAWSFVPSVSLPIFDGGARKAAVAAAEVAHDIRLAGMNRLCRPPSAKWPTRWPCARRWPSAWPPSRPWRRPHSAAWNWRSSATGPGPTAT